MRLASKLAFNWRSNSKTISCALLSVTREQRVDNSRYRLFLCLLFVHFLQASVQPCAVASKSALDGLKRAFDVVFSFLDIIPRITHRNDIIKTCRNYYK